MPNNNAEESLVKFGILSILIGLSVASVVLAAAVGLIERQPPEIQKTSLLALGVAAGLGLVVFVAICFKRRRIEEASGKLLRLPSPTGWGRGWAVSLFLLTGVILLIAIDAVLPALANSTTRNPPPNPAVIITVLTIVLSAPMIGLVYTFIMLWWQANPLSLEIREKGLIVGGLRFMPWAEKLRFTWHEEDPRSSVLTINSGTRIWNVLVSHDAKADVDKLLGAYRKVNDRS